ncbi:helix-turn-helix transcriptional regulator [Dietzia cercidiphylli]|uniref:HTH cro/C1-type domain-containing protein n=1 Tax=Dietzia cercidiphylli TaxID=498199 RepID=A0ABP4U6N6_9ACTN|nr:helix-turn-helix transcriptional regulator [Dietzia cercidiphylli]MBB1048648.1 helix-turn-helix transcriptional regulator [Dietzia cercidiphylli]
MATFAARARTLTDIATSVRDARLAAGMSQADLAAAAHLTRSWVSLFESGRAPNASLSKVLAMMDVLGVTIRLAYPVPDSDTPSAESARHPWHLPEAVDMAEAMDAPDAVDTPADDGEGLTAADPAADPAPLSESALAAARAIRATHRARAVADDITQRSSDA